jgi:hypothetical protein
MGVNTSYIHLMDLFYIPSEKIVLPKYTKYKYTVMNHKMNTSSQLKVVLIKYLCSRVYLNSF